MMSPPKHLKKMPYFGEKVVRKISAVHRVYLKTLCETSETQVKRRKFLKKQIKALYHDFMEDNEKIITANEVDTIHNKMDEVKMPEGERAAWLEAL